ncbi:MAG: hypothetical protein ACOYL6_13340 [Bacteriovoracaceae bacterium]
MMTEKEWLWGTQLDWIRYYKIHVRSNKVKKLLWNQEPVTEFLNSNEAKKVYRCGSWHIFFGAPE